MSKITDYQSAFNRAFMDFSIARRFEKLDRLGSDLASHLLRHKSRQRRMPENTALWAGGLGSVASYAAMVAGILTASPLLIVGGFCGVPGSLAAGLFISTASPVHKWLAARYEREHGDEIEALRALATKVGEGKESTLKAFRSLSPQEMARVRDLESLTMNADARFHLVGVFRELAAGQNGSGPPARDQDGPDSVPDRDCPRPEAGP